MLSEVFLVRRLALQGGSVSFSVAGSSEARPSLRERSGKNLEKTEVSGAWGLPVLSFTQSQEVAVTLGFLRFLAPQA